MDLLLQFQFNFEENLYTKCSFIPTQIEPESSFSSVTTVSVFHYSAIVHFNTDSHILKFSLLPRGKTRISRRLTHSPWDLKIQQSVMRKFLKLLPLLNCFSLCLLAKAHWTLSGLHSEIVDLLWDYYFRINFSTLNNELQRYLPRLG